MPYNDANWEHKQSFYYWTKLAQEHMKYSNYLLLHVTCLPKRLTVVILYQLLFPWWKLNKVDHDPNLGMKIVNPTRSIGWLFHDWTEYKLSGIFKELILWCRALIKKFV